MKVEIRSERFPYYEEKEMDAKQRLDLRRQITTDLHNWFAWEDYCKELQHLVVYAELDGVAYVYKQGWITTDKEYEEKVMNREGIGYCLVFHRDQTSSIFTYKTK